jgi:hypothetical protein
MLTVPQTDRPGDGTKRSIVSNILKAEKVEARQKKVAAVKEQAGFSFQYSLPA